jgi:hypothetical protein
MDEFGPFFFSLGGAGFAGILLTALFGSINERSERERSQLVAGATLHPDIVSKAWGRAIGASAVLGLFGAILVFGLVGISSASVGAIVGYLLGMMFRAMIEMPTPE